MDRLQPSRFRLSILGPFRLEGPDGRIDLSSKKASGLLALLACAGTEPYQRQRLMALLWGSHGEAQARQNLRQAVHRLRAVLGKDAVIGTGEQIALAPETVACDVIAFDQLVSRGTREALDQAIALYQGPLLADVFIGEEDWDTWLKSEREKLESQALGAMVALATSDLHEGHAESTIAIAKRALAINELREDAHRLLIQALARAGRRSEAHAHYARLVDMLNRELGTEPDALTVAVARTLQDTQPVELAAHLLADRPVLESEGATREAVDSKSVFKGSAVVVDRQSSFRHGALPLAFNFGPGYPVRAIALAAFIGMLLAGVGLASVRQSVVRTDAPNWLQASPLERNTFFIPLVVLPFKSATADDTSVAQLAEQIAEEAVNYLSRLPKLRVVPREVARDPKYANASSISAWSKTGASYAVGGSIRSTGDRIRLNVHLIDIKTQLQVWSKHYEYGAAEWPERQELVLCQLTHAINLETLRRTASQPYGRANAPTVEELLAHGWADLTAPLDAPSFKRAEAAFREVKRLDPDNLDATLGLAGFLLTAATNFQVERAAAMKEAVDLLRTAQERGAGTATLHFYLGILENLNNDAPRALQEFERAIALNPSYAAAHAFRGRVLIKLSRYSDALRSIVFAQQINDSKLVTGWTLWQAIAEFELGREESAGEALRQALATLPRNPYVHASLAGFHGYSGRLDEARQHAVELRRLTPDGTDDWRVWEFNKGPGNQPLPGRLSHGLRIALEATPK